MEDQKGYHYRGNGAPLKGQRGIIGGTNGVPMEWQRCIMVKVKVGTFEGERDTIKRAMGTPSKGQKGHQ